MASAREKGEREAREKEEREKEGRESGTRGKGSVLFIGNATTLIRYDGFTILTDPNFLHRGQRARLGYGLTSRRLTQPALGVRDLPPLDVVVLSHLHGDHWDQVAARGLDKDIPIITTLAATRALRRQGFEEPVGLETWDAQRLRGPYGTLTVTAIPARHGPGPADHLLPPVMGSVLEFGDADGRVSLRILISGDTLLVPELDAIPRRFPDIDLGIVHLGGARPLGLLTVSMDADQGAGWVDLIRPRQVLPVHYDDYPVFRSPLADFRRRIERTAHRERVVYLDRGESLELTPRSSATRQRQAR